MHAWVKDAKWAKMPGLVPSPGAAVSKPESLWTDAAAFSALHFKCHPHQIPSGLVKDAA